DVEIENTTTQQNEYHQGYSTTINGQAVGRIIVYGQSSDIITVSSNVTIGAELHASNRGGSILCGGGGNDILIGGTGHDILIGGQGRDLLIGGGGSDILLAGTGDDILIAGTTSFTHNDLALRSIESEWTSMDSYAMRMSNILGQTGGGQHLNGSYFLNSSTV